MDNSLLDIQNTLIGGQFRQETCLSYLQLNKISKICEKPPKLAPNQWILDIQKAIIHVLHVLHRSKGVMG